MNNGKLAGKLRSAWINNINIFHNLMHNFHRGKKWPKIGGASVIKKSPKEKIRPKLKNSPNLFTLIQRLRCRTTAKGWCAAKVNTGTCSINIYTKVKTGTCSINISSWGNVCVWNEICFLFSFFFKAPGGIRSLDPLLYCPRWQALTIPQCRPRLQGRDGHSIFC
jgi:hypothetical protein